MEPIRLATPEEIESIKDRADCLGQETTVVAFSGDKGVDFAVIRKVTEIDPMLMANDSGIRRALFIWSLENSLRLMGVPEFYFNIRSEDAAWLKLVERGGAKRIHEGLEIRFKKVL